MTDMSADRISDATCDVARITLQLAFAQQGTADGSVHPVDDSRSAQVRRWLVVLCEGELVILCTDLCKIL